MNSQFLFGVPKSRAIPSFVYLILSTTFLIFLIPLGRYPLPYIDESFYNYPAIRYLEGHGFIYHVSSTAPYADKLWANHAPFFPRMQITTFRLLGKNQFAMRAPDYIFAYLALFLICSFLMRRKLFWAALAVAVVWVGDRSTQEVLLGRMEGVALFFVVLGFCALIITLEQETPMACLACGAALGLAIGFHPVTALFFIASAMVLVVSASPIWRWRALFSFAAGAMLPAFLWLLCWWPDLGASYEQFQHNLKAATVHTLCDKLLNLVRVLRWSRWWLISLCLVVAGYLLPLAIWFLYRRRNAGLRESPHALWLVACLFSVVGLIALLTKAVFPYYLVYFTIWPTVALAVQLETKAGRQFRVWTCAAYLIVILGWLPSFLWNGLRAREALLYFHRLDHRRVIRQLQSVIPAHTKVVCEPIMFMIAQEAGLDYEPVAWFAEQTKPPPEVWLLVTKAEWLQPHYLSPEAIRSRRIVIECDGFFKKEAPSEKYIVLGPAVN